LGLRAGLDVWRSEKAVVSTGTRTPDIPASSLFSIPNKLSGLVVVKCRLFFHGWAAIVGLGLLIVEVSRSYSDTPHSVGLLWTSNRPVAETAT
jgi:hypothetical protein